MFVVAFLSALEYYIHAYIVPLQGGALAIVDSEQRIE